MSENIKSKLSKFTDLLSENTLTIELSKTNKERQIELWLEKIHASNYMMEIPLLQNALMNEVRDSIRKENKVIL